MTRREQKAEVITFKVEADLAEAMRSIPNRSEFIRQALISSLDRICPLCRGSGTLDSAARKHWETFARRHRVSECGDCHAQHIVCLGERGTACSR